MSGEEARPDEARTTQRVDKWLWFARLVKTRTLAADLVTSGKVRLNRVRMEKPSQTVRIDDVLTVTLNRRIRLLKVQGLGERRGPSATASLLYEELTAASDPLKPAQSSLQLPSWQESGVGHGRRLPGSGRPTKKERRDIERLGGKSR